jgi:hypothetical protein
MENKGIVKCKSCELILTKETKSCLCYLCKFSKDYIKSGNATTSRRTLFNEKLLLQNQVPENTPYTATSLDPFVK